MFVVIVSLREKEVTRSGLMSMLSSIIMIGKSSAENFWLKEPSRRHLYSTRTSPVFILTAIFRTGSFSLICAWDYILSTWFILPIAAVTVLLLLLFLKTRNHLRDLTLGNIFKIYVNELLTMSLWGHRGREQSRQLQMGMAAFLLLLYTSFLIQIIIFPNRPWFKSRPTYHPDPVVLQFCSIVTLSSGWIAFVLQILLQRGHIL